MEFKSVLSVMAAVVVLSASADPQVSNVRVSQSASRQVTILYDLSDEAVVTLAVETNYVDQGVTKWASIGEENYTNIGGDVNRLVSSGNNRKISWRPDRSWPDKAIAAGNIRFTVNAWSKTSPPDYMVVDLDGSKIVRFYTSTNAFPDGGLANDTYRIDKIVLRRCPAANVDWWMGAPTDEPGFEVTGISETRHKVTLLNDYYIGIYEITQGQVEKVGYPYNYSVFTNREYKATRPFEYTCYKNLRGTTTYWPNEDRELAHTVDNTLVVGKFRLATGVLFDLPTEAQWEFACRAGTSTGLNNGKELTGDTASAPTSANLSEVARYRSNGGGDYWAMPGVTNTSNPKSNADTSKGTAKVGSYKPNAWGIYDMHGNAAEICLDRYQADLGTEAVTDPVGATTGDNRVLRGGSYGSGKNAALRSAARASAQTYSVAYYGSRLCVTIYTDIKDVMD